MAILRRFGRLDISLVRCRERDRAIFLLYLLIRVGELENGQKIKALPFWCVRQCFCLCEKHGMQILSSQYAIFLHISEVNIAFL